MSLKLLELFLKKKKRVSKYNNYTCEHGEHLLYQNKKEKVKIMWIIISHDSRNDSLVIEITIIIFEKKKLTSTIITIVNTMNTCYIKIKRKSKNNVDNC